MLHALAFSLACPYLEGNTRGARLPPGHPPCPMRSSVSRRLLENAPTSRSEAFLNAARSIDYAAVKEDIKQTLTTSIPGWPADYGTYAPFMIRLAWHCSGSYRSSDGRGGCDGGRIRFEPERSWEDNTNLEKARRLLAGVKDRYGLGLSWGDLIILAGTTAIESMGGPVLGFCGGRMDSVDGTESAELGPTALQQQQAPCVNEAGEPVANGNCSGAGGLGSTTVGLIYLNPEGPVGEDDQPNPDPVLTAPTIRDAFGRMGMNDSETVALIGGGHAFGKTHGACPLGAGPSPVECMTSEACTPWPGLCGSGKGADAFTSGFEGPWTSKPTTWDNEYFRYLLDFEHERHMGPADHWQWRVTNATAARPTAPGPQGGTQEVMMLTSDIALKVEPAYRALVEQFANDQGAFDHAFAHAWYKLTTRDMGPVSRCLGSDVPPAQPWQYPLPPRPSGVSLPDFDEVKEAVQGLLQQLAPTQRAFDLARLAWQCSATFRSTDHLGGCNGARLRFPPESAWPSNALSGGSLDLLEPVKTRFGDALSWADLIVLAGQTAMETMGMPAQDFVGGRLDATDGKGSEHLNGTVAAFTGAATESVFQLKQAAKVMGLSNRELVTIAGSGLLFPRTQPFRETPPALDSGYFSSLLDETWEPIMDPDTQVVLEYKAAGKEVFMRPADLALLNDTELSRYVGEYAKDSALFASDFGAAWSKSVNIDRFDLENPSTGNDSSDSARTIGLAVGVPVGLLAIAGAGFLAMRTGRGAAGDVDATTTDPLLQVPATDLQASQTAEQNEEEHTGAGEGDSSTSKHLHVGEAAAGASTGSVTGDTSGAIESL